MVGGGVGMKVGRRVGYSHSWPSFLLLAFFLRTFFLRKKKYVHFLNVFSPRKTLGFSWLFFFRAKSGYTLGAGGWDSPHLTTRLLLFNCSPRQTRDPPSHAPVIHLLPQLPGVDEGSQLPAHLLFLLLKVDKKIQPLKNYSLSVDPPPPQARSGIPQHKIQILSFF